MHVLVGRVRLDTGAQDRVEEGEGEGGRGGGTRRAPAAASMRDTAELLVVLEVGRCDIRDRSCTARRFALCLSYHQGASAGRNPDVQPDIIRPAAFRPCSRSSPARPISPAQVRQFRAGTITVPVYATVRDPGHGFVLDLTKDDFEIRDEGRVQPITQFTTDVQPLSAVVLLDGSGSMLPEFNRAIEGASSFILRLLPEDRACIGSFADRVAFGPGSRPIATSCWRTSGTSSISAWGPRRICGRPLRKARGCWARNAASASSWC